MSDSNRPSLAKITAETFRELYKDVKGEGGKVLKQGLLLSPSFWVMPTYFRKLKEGSYSKSMVQGEKSSAPTPYLSFLLAAMPVVIWWDMSTNEAVEGHPEYLLLPFATNIASAFYEKAREVNRRLTDQYSTKPLSKE